MPFVAMLIFTLGGITGCGVASPWSWSLIVRLLFNKRCPFVVYMLSFVHRMMVGSFVELCIHLVYKSCIHLVYKACIHLVIKT